MGELTSGYWNTIQWTPEMCAHIQRRREERWSCIRIGVEMGISDRAIKSQLSRMGLPTTLPPITHEEAAEQHVTRPEWTDVLARIRRLAPLAAMPIPPARTCQFPYGDGPYTFCGAPTWRGSYCQTHHELCHTRVWAA